MSDNKNLKIGDSIWYIQKGELVDIPCVIAAWVLAEAAGSHLILSDNYVRNRKDLYTDPADPRIEIEIERIIKQKILLIETRLADMRRLLEKR